MQGEGAARQHAKRVEVLYLKLRNEHYFFDETFSKIKPKEK